MTQISKKSKSMEYIIQDYLSYYGYKSLIIKTIKYYNQTREENLKNYNLKIAAGTLHIQNKDISLL